MKNILLTISFALSLAVSSSVISDALSIVSDANWKSSAVGPIGWESVDFDDSTWSAARAPYPNINDPTDFIPETTAVHMWHDPDNTSNGSTGVTRAFLRVTFNLDAAPELGQARINVDDDYDFYVNGALADENHDCGYAGSVQDVDITDKLVIGKNVFAFEAIDGCWPNDRDRGGEAVLFDAIITFPEIVYSCVGFEPPLNAGPVKVKRKRALPLKAQLLDSDGIQLTVVDIAMPPVLQVIYSPAGSGDTYDVTDDALAVGLGTEGNQFEYNVDKWQYNLKTENYTAPGTYTMNMTSGDGYVIEPTCAASFVVE